MKLFFLFALLLNLESIVADLAFLIQPQFEKNICLSYNNKFTNFTNLNITLIDLTPTDACQISSEVTPNWAAFNYSRIEYVNHIMYIVKRGNCSLLEKIKNIYSNYQSTYLLLLSEKSQMSRDFNLWKPEDVTEDIIREIQSKGIYLFLIDSSNYGLLQKNFPTNSLNNALETSNNVGTEDSLSIPKYSSPLNQAPEASDRIILNVRISKAGNLNIGRDMGPFLLAAIVVIVCILGGYLGGLEYYNKYQQMKEQFNLSQNATYLRSRSPSSAAKNFINNNPSNDTNINDTPIMHDSNNNHSKNNMNDGTFDAQANSNHNHPGNLETSEFLKDLLKRHNKQSFSTANVLLMVAFMCIFLTCVWYFYKYAVYYLIYLFVIYAIVSLYHQFRFLFRSCIPCSDFDLKMCHFLPSSSPSSFSQSTLPSYLNTYNHFANPNNDMAINEFPNHGTSNPSNSNNPFQSANSPIQPPQQTSNSCALLKSIWRRIWSYLALTALDLYHELSTVKHLGALACALAICVSWAIFRHHFYAYILQDIMGASLCVYILQHIHIPNLKIGTLLLSLLFLFDIFFVFITPFLTKSKTSIMVDVVGGRNTDTDYTFDDASLFKLTSSRHNLTDARDKHYSDQRNIDSKGVFSKLTQSPKEQIPLAFKMPYLSTSFLLNSANPLYYCKPYLNLNTSTYVSYIGYGDVVMPGLLVAFCFFFDMVKSPKRPRFIYSSIVSLGYILGLTATYLALHLMKRGQPALLYLVPFTLGPVYLTALLRSDFDTMWSYDMYKQISSSTSPISIS